MRRRTRRLAIAGAGLLVVAGGAFYVWHASRSSTPVSEASAVSRFRGHGVAARGGPPPQQGVYTYAVHGWECAGVASLCLRRNLPSHARLIVTRSRAGLQLELDVSQQHVEAQRFAERGGARYLTWRRTKLSFAGVTQDDAHATTPATLALPAHLHVGQRWSARFHDSGLPVTTTSRVLRRQVVTVGGRRLPTFVIQSVSHTGGPHPGTDSELTWHSQPLGLDLRLQIDRRIRGVFPYRMQATATLLELQPAR